MAKTVDDLSVLTRYIRGVLHRANHHAKSVDAIALTIAGAVLWRKDADPLEVKEHGGEMANVLWVCIGGRRFALAYNHEDETIEVRRHTIRGEVLAAFNNESSARDIKDFFGNL